MRRGLWSCNVDDVPTRTSARKRLKSVKVATSNFKIPRKAPGDERPSDRGMDYIGPLNGLGVGCQIPIVQPEGNPHIAAYARNWQNMKGRPRRPQYSYPARKEVASLSSSEAFLEKYGRQSSIYVLKFFAPRTGAEEYPQ